MSNDKEIINILQNKLTELRKTKHLDEIEALKQQNADLKQEIENLLHPQLEDNTDEPKSYYQTKLKNKTIFCVICDTNVKYNSYSNHLKSKLHQKLKDVTPNK